MNLRSHPYYEPVLKRDLIGQSEMRVFSLHAIYSSFYDITDLGNLVCSWPHVRRNFLPCARRAID